MIVFLTSGGVLNRSLLQTKSVPKRVLSLGLLVLPRVPPWRPVFWRAIFEHPLARYSVALSPFVAAMFIWRDLAVPIAEAPLLMFLAIWLFERYGLSISDPAKRRALISEDEAGRVIDGIRTRAEAVLSRLGAERGIETGALHLVVEQTAYARIPPLSVVSVLHEDERVAILDLDTKERDAVATALFPQPGVERSLHSVSLAEQRQIHRFELEARAITAHERLAAVARKKATGSQISTAPA